MTTRLTEYLLSIQNGRGSRLVEWGAIQTLIPIFPGNMSVTWTNSPMGGYANISYYTNFDPTMLPNAFEVTAMQAGNYVINGVITAGMLLQPPVYHWVLITPSSPSIVTITNLTAFNQYFAEIDFYLVIHSEADLKRVMEALDKLTTTPLEDDAQSLLNAMQRR